jgi:hypothetical protein
LEECVAREFYAQGIEGYNKCFLMFEKIIDWETSKPLLDDPLVQKGIMDNYLDKMYHKYKEAAKANIPSIPKK